MKKPEESPESKTHLIVCPIRKVGETSFTFKICEVKIQKDSQGEYNLETVINKVTGDNILPEMDSVSKQRTLHNILKPTPFRSQEPEHIQDLRNAQGGETVQSIFQREL